MIPIPKGGKVCSTNADLRLYRSIAISSILSKILDYIIIDQHADSLATSDYQFGFKSNSSTMLCRRAKLSKIQGGVAEASQDSTKGGGVAIIILLFTR